VSYIDEEENEEWLEDGLGQPTGDLESDEKEVKEGQSQPKAVREKKERDLDKEFDIKDVVVSKGVGRPRRAKTR